MTGTTGTIHEDLYTHILVFNKFFLEQEMFQTGVVETIETHIFMLNNIFLKIVPFMRLCAKIWYHMTSHRWQYNITHSL